MENTGTFRSKQPHSAAKFRRTRMMLLAAGVSMAPFAQAEMLAIGLDRKFAYTDGGQRQALEPGRDEVVFYDLKNPAKPEFVGSVALENSIVGPPTNIAITPDQKVALVANALKSVRAPDGKGWTFAPADELFVIDLTQRPPQRVATVKVGSQPSGIAIDRHGRMGLVANRDGKSISVLAIDGTRVEVRATIPMTDSVVSVAIAPDGKRALAAKFAAHKVAVLDIGPDGAVSYSGRDLPVGLFPWTVTITPDGNRAFVSNIGANAASDGNAKTVSVIDLGLAPPRVIQHVSVGDAPEGISISPNGQLAAVTILQGSYDAPRGSWFRNEVGLATVLRLDAAGASVAQSVPVGGFPEGIAFSSDNRFVYVGNFSTSSLSILELDADGRVRGQTTMPLAGPAASLRIGSR